MSRLGEDNRVIRICSDSKNRGTNPFDSDSEADAGTPAKPFRSSPEPFLEDSSRNPLGDDDTAPEKTGDFGQASDDKKSSLMKHHTEDENVSQVTKPPRSGSSLCRISSARFVAQVMEKAVSIGETAAKTAERLKEAGLAQSQRFMARNAAEEQKQRDELFSFRREKSAPAAASHVAVSSSPFSLWWASKSKYKNDSRDEGAFENQSVEDLENYSLCKSAETTETINDCMKIAEEIREDATKTLVSLHHQGDQITRAHAEASNIDYDLSRVIASCFFTFYYLLAPFLKTRQDWYLFSYRLIRPLR